MKGHVADGIVILMTSGDTLTLQAVMKGWQLFKAGVPYGEPTNSAAVIEQMVVSYKVADSWTDFTYDGDRWSFNADELARWDEELGWDFHSFHGLTEPTEASIIEYLKSYGEKR